MDTFSYRKELFESFKDINEQVILWGGGVFGKDIGVFLRDNYNKTSIDVGATLDAWGGAIIVDKQYENKIRKHINFGINASGIGNRNATNV